MYTSGTTSKPKGVIISYSNLDSQISSLTNAWKIQNSDVVLHSLPLHHVHGVVNALTLPLSVGGKVIMLPKFDSDVVWSYLLNVNMPQKDRISVFMGVPTSYHYLIQEYDKLFSKSEQMSEYIKTHCQNKIRLMISGSAPLPQTIFNRWKEITGHKLLERYGMSEIGMCLSNTLTEDKVKQRLPGFVGHPLPGMNIRIVNPENDTEVLLEASGEYNKGLWSQNAQEEKATMKIKPGSASDAEIIGSLQVKGANVFTEYWKRPDATAKSFTSDGWFVTGDTVCYDPTVNSFKIMGRNSVDIIKSRGYKISALEIETKLLENPYIEDCAVIGVPDEILGQRIVALTVFRESKVAESSMDEIIPALKKWCESKFANYSMPSIKIMTKIPRNQMGKVNKADLMKDFVKVNSTPAT
jgi:malonyl-CoA/methylmalonyl-CoA synthetase